MACFKGSAMEPTPGRNPARIGHIPGFPVGFKWPNRRKLCDDGVHPYLVRGIHGRAKEGAFSVVVSGGYEDDCDFGDTITYTGEGGALRHPNGKWVDNAHNGDQTLERGGNRALQTSHQTGDPVRVIRGHSLNSLYAPKEGYRYDGLYTVESAELVVGKNKKFAVCQFVFKRCPDQPPIPRRDGRLTRTSESDSEEDDQVPEESNFPSATESSSQRILIKHRSSECTEVDQGLANLSKPTPPIRIKTEKKHAWLSDSSDDPM